jgi:hypothetical protein
MASRHFSATLRSCRFSTTIETNRNTNNASSPPPPPPPTKGRRHQSFVQPDIDLELGELETDLPPGFHPSLDGISRHTNDGRDSYWRPPWKNPRAEIISAEDFANRPRVTFSESFLTMHDAMAMESWMSQSDKDGMYKLYLDMMLATAGQTNQSSKSSDGNNKEQQGDITNENWGVLSTNTSHEYVIRVVAQKYNVTTSRAAGVIQLQHNEEQLKKDPTFTVNHAIQAYMDNKMRDHIREIYQSYGEKDPLQFVEDPVASTGRIGRGEDTRSENMVAASELIDVDALLMKTRMQEIEKARIRIANHVYVEDVDDRTRLVPIDQEVKRLMKMDEKLKVELRDGDTTNTPQSSKKKQIRLKIPKGASPFPDNNRGFNATPETRRPRWKYAAQIINTQMLENPPGSTRGGKKAASRVKARRHGRVVEGNTLIEEGGKLRVANMSELEQTSWKHVRNESEFMFKGVKDAWLRRQLEGEVDGWGMQEEVFKVETKLIDNTEVEEGGNVGDAVEVDDAEDDEENATGEEEGETADEE